MSGVRAVLLLMLCFHISSHLAAPAVFDILPVRGVTRGGGRGGGRAGPGRRVRHAGLQRRTLRRHLRKCFKLWLLDPAAVCPTSLPLG